MILSAAGRTQPTRSRAPSNQQSGRAYRRGLAYGRIAGRRPWDGTAGRPRYRPRIASRRRISLCASMDPPSTELFDEIAQHRLRISEQHPRIVADVELIVDAGEARILAALHRND